MALNTRGMDPRFAGHHSRAVAGWMGAQIEIYKVSTPGVTPAVWDPLNDPEAMEPVGNQVQTLIYRGRARVQPNKDWRARLMEWQGQVATTHAVRIQVDYVGNLLIPNAFPTIEVQDIVQVLSAPGMLTPEEAHTLTRLTYTVRNIPESSNAWQKTLLCDVTMNQVRES